MPYRISVTATDSPITHAQKHSRDFETNPRIGPRTVRRGFPLLFSDGDYEASKPRIERLLAAEAIVVEKVSEPKEPKKETAPAKAVKTEVPVQESAAEARVTRKEEVSPTPEEPKAAPASKPVTKAEEAKKGTDTKAEMAPKAPPPLVDTKKGPTSKGKP